MENTGEFASFQRYRCNDCGFEHFVDRAKRISPSLYEFDSDYNDDLIVSESINSLMQWNHRSALSYLNKVSDPRGLRTLDVGCFNGFFVAQLLRRGFKAEGIDFNKKALDFGKGQFGLDGKISDASLQDLLDAGNQFSVITCFEVLEHLPAPAEFMGKLSALVAPGGLLIISVPNNYMFWRPKLDTPPHHLSRFTPAALKGLGESQGLLVRGQAEQASLFNMLRHMTGSLFRTGADESLRGGKFRAGKLVHLLRRIANRISRVLDIVLWPIDRSLYVFGFRYISQIVVLQKLP